MDAVDVLMEARAYIEKGWCQGWFAKNEQGHMCDESDESAVSWCAVGSLLHASREGIFGDDPDDVVGDALTLLNRAAGSNVQNFNDAPGRTQEEVLEAFDRAIGLGLERAGER